MPTLDKVKKMSPTARQVDALSRLPDEALCTKAVECLHSLNRRAKEKRDRVRKYRRTSFADEVDREIEAIYSLKTEFLQAAVEAEHAEVFTFDRAGPRRLPEWDCGECERSWRGEDGTCFRCDSFGDVVDDGRPVIETWYVVQVGDHRFHQPKDEASAAMRAIAQPTTPHDPAQPQRKIPKVDLTLEAQRRCIAMASQRLRAQLPLSA